MILSLALNIDFKIGECFAIHHRMGIGQASLNVGTMYSGYWNKSKTNEKNILFNGNKHTQYEKITHHEE